MRRFKTIFLEGITDLFDTLDQSSRRKILFNIEKAEYATDPKLLKKLRGEIWKFRIKSSNQQIRLLAFWDKRDKQQSLVICTHGFIKKSQKIPGKEIEKAERLRMQYFDNQ